MDTIKTSTAIPLRFTWLEFSGSLGDLGLFIPLVVAMTIRCDLNIGIILISAGFMNILTGWLFRQPIPVQPMKAIAAVVITEGLIREDLIAAGILMGLFLLCVSGIINKISQIIPKPIVRGIQLGIGLKLVLIGVQWVSGLSFIGWDSIFVSIAVIGFLICSLNWKQPVLLYVFLVGLLILYIEQPQLFSTFSLTWPQFSFFWPSASAWTTGMLKGALPQIPLTILNSVVALCALSTQYFPGKGVQPKKIAVSVGLMNIVCVPLGGIPMCHGSGGLAAQYRFGARTGGSVIILGLLKIFIGILFGGVLLGLLQNYPIAVLAPMLVFAGVELARTSHDCFGETQGLVIALVTAAVILGANTWAGFIAGSLVSSAFFFNQGGKIDSNKKKGN